MGDWLVDKGLDAPRAARPKAPSLNALRRRQGQQYRSVPFGPPHTSANSSFGKQVLSPCRLFMSPFGVAISRVPFGVGPLLLETCG
jgi:hypothetical protein